MRLAELGPAELRERLRRGELALPVGPYVARVRSELEGLARALSLLYADFPVLPGHGFADFHVHLKPIRRWRRGFAAEVAFLSDATEPFLPLPRDQAAAFLEWGLNWCLSQHVEDLLTVHSAVVENDGRALLLPGAPGSGKSTLCAALVARGWRLLSDEFALLRLDGRGAAPAPRPISLKNASIELIRARLPQAALTDPVPDTHKGVIAHMRPPADSVRRRNEDARPGWIVFPRFQKGAAAELASKAKSAAHVELAQNSFNYAALGEAGFRCLAAFIAESRCAELAFGDLDAGLAALEGFVSDGCRRVPGVDASRLASGL
jgi:HprK-related kinase A